MTSGVSKASGTGIRAARVSAALSRRVRFFGLIVRLVDPPIVCTSRHSGTSIASNVR